MSFDIADGVEGGIPSSLSSSFSKSVHKTGAEATGECEGEGGIMTSHAAKMSPGVFFRALVYAIIVLKRKAKKIIRRRREKRSRVKSKLRDTIARSNRQVKDASFGRQIMRPTSAQPLQQRSGQELLKDAGGNEYLKIASLIPPGAASKPFTGAVDVSSVLDHKVISQSKLRARQIVDRIKLMSPSDQLGISGGRAKVSAANYDFFRLVLEKNKLMHKSRSHGTARQSHKSGGNQVGGDGVVADSSNNNESFGGLASGDKRLKLRREMKQMKKRDLQEVLQYDAGTAVYFGSTVALQSRHGGFLSFAGSDIKASAYKILPSTRFTIWSADALDETGVVRYGDAIWLQAGQHEVLGAIYVPSQSNNEAPHSHAAGRHTVGHHSSGGGGGGVAAISQSHGQTQRANIHVDRRNINTYEITPTIINCRGTANFTKAKQYGRWIILHRNKPAEMMGQLVQHFDHVLLEQEWSYLASHTPYDAFMDNRRLTVAQGGVDLVTITTDANESDKDDDEQDKEVAEQSQVRRSSASTSTAANGSHRLRVEPHHNNIKKDKNNAVKNMFACSLDATWKLHIVALPSDDNADNRFRQLIMSEATDQMRQSADIREIKAQFFATPMEKRIDPTLLEDHVLNTSLRHKTSDEANQERLLHTFEMQQRRDFKDPLRDAIGAQQRPHSASAIADGSFNVSHPFESANLASRTIRRRGGAVSGRVYATGADGASKLSRLRAIEDSYWTQAEGMLVDTRSWTVVSAQMQKYVDRESRHKELAARIIQRFFKVHLKVESWRQKFIELDFNRIRELQHYTGQTFKDFEEFRSYCKKKMAVDYNFMTKIIGFFGPSYKSHIARPRTSPMKSPTDAYRRSVRGEALSSGDRVVDHAGVELTSSKCRGHTSGSSFTLSDAERPRTPTHCASFADDQSDSIGMRPMFDEAAERKRLEEEKEKRVSSMRNKLAEMTREKFGDEIQEIMNHRKVAQQPSFIQVASSSSFSVTNKDLSRPGQTSFDASQPRPASAALSRNMIASKSSFDAITKAPASARQLHKSASGPILPYTTETASEYGAQNNYSQQPFSGATGPVDGQSRGKSKEPVVVMDDPRIRESLSGLPSDVFDGLQHNLSLSTSLRFLRATKDGKIPSSSKSGLNQKTATLFDDIKVRKKRF